MRIVILAENFSKQTGYIENTLPKALARLGPEVHVVATNLQANYRLPNYKDVYEPFQGPMEVPCGTEVQDGFTLHRLPSSRPLGYARIRGLTARLRALKPDVVQTLAAASWIPLEAASAQPVLGYKLFTAAHQTASVFPRDVAASPPWAWARWKSWVRRAVPGRIVNTFAVKCYAATTDCAEVAVRYYGVPAAKVEVCPLGVDTDRFHAVDGPASAAARAELRASLGIAPGEVVCIYTGRFTPAKNPLCLAQAVERLVARGRPFRGLFLGEGPQAEAIRASAGCLTRPFVPWTELPAYYRVADVGVWPTQESMSMLDAAAVGIPTVVSDRLVAVERIEGNGRTYREGDADDLARVLDSLSDPVLRAELGRVGSEKVCRHYSWLAIARRRLGDYEAALRGRRGART